MSTSIAETSLTIESIRVVVDSGLVSPKLNSGYILPVTDHNSYTFWAQPPPGGLLLDCEMRLQKKRTSTFSQ